MTAAARDDIATGVVDEVVRVECLGDLHGERPNRRHLEQRPSDAWGISRVTSGIDDVNSRRTNWTGADVGEYSATEHVSAFRRTASVTVRASHQSRLAFSRKPQYSEQSTSEHIDTTPERA